MSIALQEVTARHPCFSQGRPNNKGRIHLPVCPTCNIGCNFCERSVNNHEQRPGVTSRVLTPLEALEVVRKALRLNDALSVVGIAGPGDTLASPYATETFRLVANEFPKLIKCMSTNGLLLPQRAQELIDVGIDTLTVTVNDIYPKTQAQLCAHIIYEKKRYTGETAAEILIQNQLEGIRRVTGAGMIVKVNTVLVPEINGEHIADIARAVKQAGASLYNIIPLIPQHNLAWCAAPSCTEIDAARTGAQKFIPVFRHCQHCRADAIGVPGGPDLHEQIYGSMPRQENVFSHG